MKTPSKFTRATTVILLIIFSMCGCGGKSDAPVELPKLPAIQGNVSQLSISSTNIVPSGVVYPVFIYLPPGYEQSTQLYPIIYGLDGDNTFSDLPCKCTRFELMAQLLEAEGVKAIVVGIGNAARRDTDYLMPGAQNYYNFMTRELIPLVESKYRVDTTNRGIAGHSYGGLFAIYAMLLDRPQNRFFKNFIAQDPSIQYQSSQVSALEKTLFDRSAGQLPGTTLIMSGGSSSNGPITTQTYESLLKRNYIGLTLVHQNYANVSHSGEFQPSFADAIRFLYKGN